MPIPNWTMSRTAAPMQLPRNAVSREASAADGASCRVVVRPCFSRTRRRR